MFNVSPLHRALEDLYVRLRALDHGAVADYIPELGAVNPGDFGICVATLDGHVYEMGDARLPFTIQSISKAFVYGLALEDVGLDATLEKVGLEPSGEAFNAISLEPESGRPRNPMINAGAIATAGLVSGEDNEHKMARVMDYFAGFVGHPLTIDDAVYRSERGTGHRNRAIAYLLRNAGILGDDVDDVLDRYFRQCSLRVTCADLALMAATLANGGVSPATGSRVLSHNNVERVMSVMSTCGMYDYAGSWLYRVGMPAKSGVGGGVIAVLPGQLGIGVYSPLLDEFGNSVRGVAVCEALSSEFGLHLLRPPVHPASVVMTSYSVADVSSKRRRSDAEMRCLSERGSMARVFRLQGPLVFSTAEVALRTALVEMGDSSVVVFDCQRVHVIDEPIVDLFSQFCSMLSEQEGIVAFAGLREGQGWERIAESTHANSGVHYFPLIDDALEWCENYVLSEAGALTEDAQEIDIAGHHMLDGLPPGTVALLSRLLVREDYAQGAQIVTQGSQADHVYFLTRGRVGVYLGLPSGDRYRIATMGPGSVFGEMALVDAQPRTADVDAETAVTCFALPTDALREADALRSLLVERLARDLAARLRRTDIEIMALAQ